MTTVKKRYVIYGTDRIIEAGNPAAALGIFLKRGPFGLGRAWTFTRMPDGWIVASDKAGKNLERRTYRLREADYDRNKNLR